MAPFNLGSSGNFFSVVIIKHESVIARRAPQTFHLNSSPRMVSSYWPLYLPSPLEAVYKRWRKKSMVACRLRPTYCRRDMGQVTSGLVQIAGRAKDPIA